jgi:hypothetical protein
MFSYFCFIVALFKYHVLTSELNPSVIIIIKNSTDHRGEISEWSETMQGKLLNGCLESAVR